MELTGKKGIGNLLKIFLQICFYVGILVLVGLPFVLNLMGLNLNACMFVIYPNGIVLLIIAKKFIKLFDSLKNKLLYIKYVLDKSTIGIIKNFAFLLILLFLFSIIWSINKVIGTIYSNIERPIALP